MQRISSYRSGIDAGEQRSQSPRVLRRIAVLGMLASLSLGCTSPGPARGNLAGASRLGLDGVEEPGGGEVGEDPQLAAAFTRLAEARAERDGQAPSARLTARQVEPAANAQTADADRRPGREGASSKGASSAPPASELLPGSRPASIPEWPRMR